MACPDLEALERYALNSLDPPSSQRIADHLTACADCSSRLSEIDQVRQLEQPLRDILTSAGETTDGSAPPAIPGYDIQRELGQGGMGVVYEAVQHHPRRRVAIKVLAARRRADKLVQRLWRREVTALARLRHESIATLFEVGTADDRCPFFAMELVKGTPLAQYADQRHMSTRNRVALFARICATVAYAHQRGVIHRDLKPSNVLVTPDGTPKVLDFGLARLLALDDEEASASDSVLLDDPRVFGTLPYMSPEHVRGDAREIDVRSDVYSLGVMLYELLTGRPPYRVERHAFARAATTIIEAPPVPPHRICRSVRGDLETIVLKALAKAPARRYSSAAELESDLQRYLRCEPIVARPPTLGYQLRMLARRNCAAVAASALACVALLGGTAAATWQADAAERRFEYARQTAEYLLNGIGSRVGALPGAQDLTRHLAEEVYVFYRRLADERPDDLDALQGLTRVLRRLIVLSDDPERRTVLMHLLAQRLEAADAEQPEHPVIQTELGHLETLRGTRVLQAGDTVTARACYREAERRFTAAAGWYERNLNLADPAVWTVVDTGPFAGRMPPQVSAWYHLAQTKLTLARILEPSESESAANLLAEAEAIADHAAERDPTSEPLYRRDLSEYAPLAPPILLRNGSGPMWHALRAAIERAQDELRAPQARGKFGSRGRAAPAPDFSRERRC